MRLALIIRLTIGKAYYENTFRVFHHSLNIVCGLSIAKMGMVEFFTDKQYLA
mgnify:CR=1 FL=1